MIEAPFRATAKSHVGRKRQVNQDWFAIEDIEHANGVYHLLILADGMGGGLKGDVASHTAVEAVLQYFRSARWYNPESAAREAAFSANRAVFDKGTGGGQAPRSFMGTTLVFALVEEVTNRFWLANIGDSRAYLLRQGALEQLTRDHSVVADLEHEGPALSEEELARLRNVVTRAVGLEATVAPDIFGPFELETGDRILLSSDGLHGVVKDDRIQRLAAAADMERALKSLISAANGAGGPDNITVVMGGREAAVTGGGGGNRNRRMIAVVVGGALAAVALVVAVARVSIDEDRDNAGGGGDLGASVGASTPGVDSHGDASKENVREPYVFEESPPDWEVIEVTSTSNHTCSHIFVSRVSARLGIWGGRSLPSGFEQVYYERLGVLNGIAGICASLPTGPLKVPTDAWVEEQTK